GERVEEGRRGEAGEEEGLKIGRGGLVLGNGRATDCASGAALGGGGGRERARRKIAGVRISLPPVSRLRSYPGFIPTLHIVRIALNREISSMRDDGGIYSVIRKSQGRRYNTR